jgi:hypothetical protein
VDLQGAIGEEAHDQEEIITETIGATLTKGHMEEAADSSTVMTDEMIGETIAVEVKITVVIVITENTVEGTELRMN